MKMLTQTTDRQSAGAGLAYRDEEEESLSFEALIQAVLNGSTEARDAVESWDGSWS